MTDLTPRMPAAAVTPVGAPPRLSREAKCRSLRQVAAFQLAHGSVRQADRLALLALWIDPGCSDNLRMRAHTLARRGSAEAALSLLLRARKARGGKVRLGDWLTIGAALARGGDLKRARSLLLRSRDETR